MSIYLAGRQFGGALSGAVLALVLFISANAVFADENVVLDHGADKTGAASVDASFAAATTAALTDSGIVYLPAGQYRLTDWDLTEIEDLVIRGDGAGRTVILADTAGTLIDFTGSNNIRFEDIEVVSYGGQVPEILFKVLGAPPQEVIQDGIFFDRTRVRAKSSVAHFYAYGFRRMTVRDSVWDQLYNGAPLSNGDYHLLTSVVKVDAFNRLGFTSAHANEASGPNAAMGLTIINSQFNDRAEGVPIGDLSNNAVVVGMTMGQAHFISTQFRSKGPASVVLWDNTEANTFTRAEFHNTSGAPNETEYYIVMAGGLTGALTLTDPFFSVPRQAFMGLGPRVAEPYSGGAQGGISRLTILGTGAGGGGYKDLVALTEPYSDAQAIEPGLYNIALIDAQGLGMTLPGGISDVSVIKNQGDIVIKPATTLSPNDKSGRITLSTDNLTATHDGSSHHAIVRANKFIRPNTANSKRYWEVQAATGSASVNIYGIQDRNTAPVDGAHVGGSGKGAGFGYSSTGASVYASGFASSGTVRAPGTQRLRFAYDATAGKLWVGDAAGWFSGDPAAGTSPTFTLGGVQNEPLFPAMSMYGGTGESQRFVFDGFAYAVPAGFEPL